MTPHHPKQALGNEAAPIVLVAVCTGTRCAALRRFDNANPPPRARVDPSNDSRTTLTASEQKLHGAIAARAGAVLVSMPCLGPCSHASVTAIGPGIARPPHLMWQGRPTLIGLSESRDRADAIAAWISTTAPDPATLPDMLRNES